MSLAGLWLLIAILGVGIAIALALTLSQRQAPRTRETARNLAAQPSIFDLHIGDIVQYLGQDWVVEGKLVYEEAGFSWLEYMLQDGNEIRWLSVEEDDWVTVSLLAPVTDLEVSDTPPPELLYQGDVYRCAESGTATMRREGNPRRPEAEHCHYFDYTSSDNKVLSIENWDGDLEVTAGSIIAPRSLTLLPGEGRSVYRDPQA